MKLSRGRIIIFSLSILTFIAIIVGIATRSSYINDIDISLLSSNSEKLYVGIEDIQDKYFTTDIITLDDLLENSDYVVKIKRTNEIQIMERCLLTKCEVKKVYKTKDTDKIHDYIYIYEPATFSVQYNLFMTTGGYNFMNSQHEYIVFLKDLKIPDGYKASTIEENSFMFTNPQLSLFNCSQKNTTILIDESKYREGSITYNMIKDYDILFIYEEEKQIYDKIREQVISRYNSL